MLEGIRTMKIGIMLRSVGDTKGGIVVYAMNVLNALLKLDSMNQYVIMYRHRADMGRFSHFPNVSEKVIAAPNKLIWDQIAVPLFARRENLDVIYNPKLSIPLITRSKTILAMHGGGQLVMRHLFRWWDRMYVSVANPLYCKKAAAIITMTNIGARDIVKYMGADPRKMRVIPEAYNDRCRVLEEAETVGVKEKYRLPREFILFVGGIQPMKNFGNLLRAYHKIHRSIPHKLVAVGFNRWKFSDDLKLIDELGLRDKIIFPGFVADEEVPAFYNLASLFVLPSLYEGFGIPVLEAMASGCPVITSKTGCSPEVAGDAALLIDPYDPDDIAGAIQKILTDTQLRDELIQKGLQRAQQFSWEKCARETLHVFESVQSGNTSS
jgi:glycosyltransferase involved in cell wall biosynthesis